MKTPQRVEEARLVLAQRLTEATDVHQANLLRGMLLAMVWVADGESCSTVDRVLLGEPLAPRRRDRERR